MSPFNEALLDATRRVITGVSSFLPSFLAFFVTVLVFSLLGLVLGAICGRVLRALRFDERLQGRGASWIANWVRHGSPTLWVQRGIFWAGLTLGWLLGLVALGAGMKSPMVPNVVEFIPRIATVSVVLVLGHLLARFLSRAVLINAVNRQIPTAGLLGTATYWLIMVFVAAMVLEHLRVGNGIVRLAFALIVGGIVLTVSIAVGLGTKDLVRRSLTNRINPQPAADAREAGDDLPPRMPTGNPL